jgi:hypothetical protein
MVLVSWRWDITNSADYRDSNLVNKCFLTAKKLNFRYLMIDVVTLDQRSVDANAVLYFVQAYSTHPVIVAVDSAEERERYRSRFWTNYEMLLYDQNKQVLTLDSLPPPKPVSNNLQSILVSASVSATFNFDRLRVFILQLPFGNVFGRSILRAIRDANVSKVDAPLETVNELINLCKPMTTFLATRLFDYAMSKPIRYVLVIIWLVLVLFVPLFLLGLKVLVEDFQDIIRNSFKNSILERFIQGIKNDLKNGRFLSIICKLIACLPFACLLYGLGLYVGPALGIIFTFTLGNLVATQVIAYKVSAMIRRRSAARETTVVVPVA